MSNSSVHPKSVNRIEQPDKGTQGWQVRVAYEGKLYTKFFNDRIWGGKDEALAAAIDHRNQLEEQLGKPRTEETLVGRSRKRRGKMPNPKFKSISRIDQPAKRTHGWYVQSLVQRQPPGEIFQ